MRLQIFHESTFFKKLKKVIRIIFAGIDGIILVDTTENRECALKIMEDFRKITDKPITGIILTHHHGGKIFYLTLLLFNHLIVHEKLRMF